MKLFVKVKVNKKEEKIEKIDENHFLVFIKERPEKGKANKAVLELLGKYFNISSCQLKILSGKTSRNKIISIS